MKRERISADWKLTKTVTKISVSMVIIYAVLFAINNITWL